MSVEGGGGGACGTVMWVCTSFGCKARTGSTFIAPVLCGFPVYCLSIAGERFAMGSVEQEKMGIMMPETC